MSVIFKTVKRPSDPRVENSPKRYYPQLITLGRSVDLKFIAQKIQDRSSLSVGDIKSTIQNFVEKLKEQLLEGKAVNIEGLGVFMLAAKSKGSEKQEDITAKSVDSVRIYFQANKELKITKTATRAGEKLDLISLDDYLKGTADGGNGDIVDDPTANGRIKGMSVWLPVGSPINGNDRKPFLLRLDFFVCKHGKERLSDGRE